MYFCSYFLTALLMFLKVNRVQENSDCFSSSKSLFQSLPLTIRPLFKPAC